MIADGDRVARNAFRVGLLASAREKEDTPLPVNTTQELDPSDILEVHDVAEAIARAEQLVPTPSRPRADAGAPSSCPSLPWDVEGDLFESLGRLAADDTEGPAIPAPIATAEQLLRPESILRATHPDDARELAVAVPVSEDDAYLHPAGRIRSLADVTLDGYRPEPTLLVRARGRRRTYSWIFGGLLLPLVVMAALALLGGQETATATTTIATATIVTTAARPSIPALPSPPATTVRALLVPAQTPQPIVTAVRLPVSSQDSVPVFDVNSLPTAGSRGKMGSAR